MHLYGPEAIWKKRPRARLARVAFIVLAAGVLVGLVGGSAVSHDEDRNFGSVSSEIPAATTPGAGPRDEIQEATAFEAVLPSVVPDGLTFAGAFVTERAGEIQDLEFGYRTADGGVVFFTETTAAFEMSPRSSRTIALAGGTAEYRLGTDMDRPEYVAVTWKQGDVYVLAQAILTPALSEEDFFATLDSAASASHGEVSLPATASVP